MTAHTDHQGGAHRVRLAGSRWRLLVHRWVGPGTRKDGCPYDRSYDISSHNLGQPQSEYAGLAHHAQQEGGEPMTLPQPTDSHLTEPTRVELLPPCRCTSCRSGTGKEHHTTPVTVARVVDARQLKRELEHIGEHVLADLSPGGSIADAPMCGCCSHDDNRPGVVHVSWMPNGGTKFETLNVCTDCAPAAVRDVRDHADKIYTEIGRWT